MILRKPYAFLIKNFKLIHLILTVLMFLFFQKLKSLVDYFNSYIDLKRFENIPGIVNEVFDSALLYLPIIIIIVISIVMWLLITKKKPVKFYVISIITYLIEIVAVIVAYMTLVTIQQGEPDSTLIMVFRDFLEFLVYVPIPLMIIAISRSIGFNMKRFNFKKDMLELDIAEEDNEEFEVEVNIDTEDIKSKLNRKKRFIKYVYLENKAVFWVGGILTIIAIAVGVYIYSNSGEKIYLEKEIFNSYGVDVFVEQSYKIKKDPIDKTIKSDKFYVVVLLNLKNNLDEEVKIPYNKIYLKVTEQDKYSPTDEYKEYFNEFGLRYFSYDNLEKLENQKYILVYEVDDKYQNNNFILEYLTKEENNEIFEYAKVALIPKEYKESTLVTTKKLGENLTFEESLISGTEITISEIEINSKFNYKYFQTIGGVEKEFIKTIVPTNESIYEKTIMKLKVDLKENTELNPKIYSSIFEKYVTIEYNYNGKINIQKPRIIDLTLKDSEYVYLEVISDIAKSDEVSMIFNIRDKKFKYELIKKEEK